MIISISAIKGGSGKSTTAAAMAAGLRLKKKRVLLVDVDAQGNTTETTGASIDGSTADDVLTGTAKAADAIQCVGNFGDIIPASPGLAGIAETDSVHSLKKALKPIQGQYDFIIIDTPPSVGILTKNALTAADGVIIPTGADRYGMRGFTHLYEFITGIKKNINPSLKICGVLLTRHSEQRVILRDYAEEMIKVAAQLGTRLYKTHIRECVAVREAQAMGKTIFEYDPNGNAAADYMAFITEFIKTAGGK